MNAMRTLLIMLVSLLPLLASTGALAQPAKVSASIAVREGEPMPGETATLGVVLDVAPGWHIQAGEGSPDYRPPYIPTTIALSLPDGWTAGTITWPQAHEFTLGPAGFTETLSGYEGRTLAAVAVTIPGDTPPGDYTVSATIGYQACNDEVCIMPTDVNANGTITVVADRPADAAIPDAMEALFEATVGPAGATAPADPGPAGTTGADSTARVRASAVWQNHPLVPGADAKLGILMDIQKGWHIQAGEGSGDELPDALATELELRVPDGWLSERPRWPEAHAFQFGKGEFAADASGYEGRVLAVLTVKVADDAAPGEYPLTATLAYQACDDSGCEFPVEVEVNTTASVVAADGPRAGDVAPVDPAIARLFEETLAYVSAGAPTSAKKAGVAVGLQDLRWWLAMSFVLLAMVWMVIRTFAITTHARPRVFTTIIAVLVGTACFLFVRGMTAKAAFDWVPYTEVAFEQSLAENKVAMVKFTADWCANCQVNEGIIKADDDAVKELSRPDVVAFKVDFTGPHPDGQKRKDAIGKEGIPLIAVYHPSQPEPAVIRGQLASADIVIDALRGEGVVAGSDRVLFNLLGWQFSLGAGATIFILMIAFAAGFLMNFTPCVLPVIPLKILSIQAHAKEPARCFALGLVFGLGIVALYAVLGVLMAGFGLAWGEQFQKWWLNGILGLFVGAMGLGMLGLFAIRLPQAMYMFNPQSDTAGGSFFMGIFTAVLSTPCTGPLLAATVAWTATQPAAIAFLALLIMGLGMAFPYVLLTAKPTWVERMPRTGPGSELVKQVMGVLMIAVASYFVVTAAKGYQVRADAPEIVAVVGASDSEP
jgi:cytochrome c biogenesis protein CcdA